MKPFVCLAVALSFAALAYQMQDFQIIGVPDWANTDRFDVEGKFDPTAATAPGPPPQVPRMMLMLRTLLRDRVGMVARVETREMPILALRVTRADGRLGPHMKPSTVDCAALLGGRGKRTDGRGFSLGERPLVIEKLVPPTDN